MAANGVGSRALWIWVLGIVASLGVLMAGTMIQWAQSIDAYHRTATAEMATLKADNIALRREFQTESLAIRRELDQRLMRMEGALDAINAQLRVR